MAAISIPIISDFDGKGLDKAVREFQRLETTGQKAQFAISKAAVPAAAALGVLADFGGDAVKAFMEDDKAAQLLATSLKNTTGATDAQIKSVEGFITKTSIAAAVSDDELRPALDKLVRGTGDVTKAQDLLSLALDISAGTGKDLGSVSDALSKAFNGQLGPLKKLDPALASLIENGATTDEVFAALGTTFKGAASTSANTASGKMKSFSIQMNEFKESVGAAVMPIINKLLPAFQKIGNWISSHVGLVVGIGVAIAGIAAAVLITNAAITAWNALVAITAAVNAVAATSFSALWVASGAVLILAVVAALIALQVKFDIFGKTIDAIKAGFDAVWAAIKWVFDWVKDHWELLLAILTGPFGLAALVVIKFKDDVIAFFGNIISWVTDHWKLILAVITGPFGLAVLAVVTFKDKIIDIISTLVSMVGRVFGTVAGAITAPFKAAFNAISDLWNSTIGAFSIKIPSWVPVFGGNKFDMPNMPRMANGGIVTGPTVAMVGESGPEAIIPLSKLGSMGFGGGGNTINITVQGADPNEVVRALQAYNRNVGKIPVSVQ